MRSTVSDHHTCCERVFRSTTDMCFEARTDCSCRALSSSSTSAESRHTSIYSALYT
jgi:hypothetical protein